MDIGTAKPTPEQRRTVYHHMIDVVEPNQPYSVGDFLRDARSAIDGVLMSGSTPIVVGGTGLYIRALTRGLFHGPPADLDLREKLLRKEAEGGTGTLYAELVNVDAEAAVKIHPNDLRRTVRALEVFHLRDRKLSDLQREHAFKEKHHEFKLIFLTRTREELYRRIEHRVDLMIEQGLEQEVAALLARGLHPELASMQGLGYRHFLEYLAGKSTRSEAVSLLKRDTKRFAKRQFTWFRREPNVTWLDISGVENPGEIAARIKEKH